jgi:hypothetical protein
MIFVTTLKLPARFLVVQKLAIRVPVKNLNRSNLNGTYFAQFFCFLSLGESHGKIWKKGAERGSEGAAREKKQGTLRSGKSGKKVTSKKQAIAIGLSKARNKGAKVPAKKTSRES